MLRILKIAHKRRESLRRANQKEMTYYAVFVFGLCALFFAKVIEKAVGESDFVFYTAWIVQILMAVALAFLRLSERPFVDEE